MRPAITARFRSEPIRLPILYRWRVVLRRLCGMVDTQNNVREVYARFPADARAYSTRGAGNVVGFVSVDRLP